MRRQSAVLFRVERHDCSELRRRTGELWFSVCSPLTFVGEEDGGVPLALADALALALAHAVPLPPLALPAATKSTAVSLKVN